MIWWPRERDTGAYTAIQCKFYEPTHTLAKADIDSFFTASGKKPFTNRVIISTTDKWGTHAEDALDGQSTPVQRINLADIAESPIDWDIALARRRIAPQRRSAVLAIAGVTGVTRGIRPRLSRRSGGGLASETDRTLVEL